MQVQKVNFDPYIETWQAHQLEHIAEFAASCDLEPPYTLEIGSNRGRFLAGMAALDPSRSVIGVELKRKLTEIANRRLERRGLRNARALHADATLAIPMLFGPKSVERAFMLFPDPWWKRRHAKRRLIQPDFLQLLASCIPEGGTFIVKTDVAPYYEVAREEVFAECAQFRLLTPEDADWPEDEASWPLTTRERHIEDEGRPIYKLYAIRSAAPPTAEPAEPLEPQRFDKGEG